MQETCRSNRQRCTRVVGASPDCLLHAEGGRQKIASFLAITLFVKHLMANDLFFKFTSIRGKFEAMLLDYEYLTQQVVRQRRGAAASAPIVRDLYLEFVERLIRGELPETIVNAVIKDARFKGLGLRAGPGTGSWQGIFGTKQNRKPSSEARFLVHKNVQYATDICT